MALFYSIPVKLYVKRFQVLPLSGIGTIVASLLTILDNGFPFNGDYGFGSPSFDDSGLVEIKGNRYVGFNVVLSRTLLITDSNIHNVTITATQNGVTIYSSFSFGTLTLIQFP